MSDERCGHVCPECDEDVDYPALKARVAELEKLEEENEAAYVDAMARGYAACRERCLGALNDWPAIQAIVSEALGTKATESDEPSAMSGIGTGWGAWSPPCPDEAALTEERARFQKLAKRIVDIVPYVLATLPYPHDGRQKVDGGSWSAVHTGRALSSATQLENLLAEAKAMLTEKPGGEP